jgi:hypothetical protein
MCNVGIQITDRQNVDIRITDHYYEEKIELFKYVNCNLGGKNYHNIFLNRKKSNVFAKKWVTSDHNIEPRL